MNTVGFETRAIRARRAAARIDPGLPMLVAAVLAVFACFFAIGRATGAGSPRAEAPSSLPTAFHSAASPIHLGSAVPIEISLAASAHHRSSRRSQPISTPTASAPAQALAPEVPRAPLHSSPSVQPVSPPSEKAPPSPVSVSPPPTSESSRGAGNHSRPSASGGGSFESSG
jgi:hypothetical protein